MRKIELWVEIHELNHQGEYSAVEVQPKPEVKCAGVLQLQQVCYNVSHAPTPLPLHPCPKQS